MALFNGNTAGTKTEEKMNIEGDSILSEGIRDCSVTEEGGRKRDEWQSEKEFLFSCISLSVGLGNIWRFPFVCGKNGGGAFLIPYIIVLLVIGKPMYFMELAWGQFSSYGQVKAWKMVPLLKGVGYGELIASMSGGSYYCAVVAVALHYLVQSFQSTLPWSKCDESWAKVCNANKDLNYFNDSNNSKSLPELYFENEVIKGKSQIFDGVGMPDLRLTLYLLAAWALIFISLIKGIKSSGKVAYFTALFPYAVLIIFLIRGITLPGAVDGVKYFITPQWDKLLDLSYDVKKSISALLRSKVWYAAVTQCFFSLAIGFGPTMINASFNKFRHNIYRDAMVITITDSLTSILAGFIVFSILGNLAYVSNVKIADIAQSGPGLAFVSFSEAISKFDFMPQLFSVLFFMMLLTLGIGTATAMANGIITVICDHFTNLKRIYATVIVCTCGFLLGTFYVTPGGPFLITLVDYFGASFVIYIMATLEVIGVAWIYGVSNFSRDIEFMLNIKIGRAYKICWAALVPTFLIVILLSTLYTAQDLTHDGVRFPSIAILCGWTLSACAIAVVPICAIHTVFKRKGTSVLKKFWDSMQPSADWGPKDNQLKKEWIIYKNEYL